MPMHEDLIEFIERLKANPLMPSYNEAETKQAMILPLLELFGWDRDNPDEVKPEYSVGANRIDFSLRIGGRDKVFLEVKQINTNLELHTEQLLNYAFRQGVNLAVLTNGITWWFYLPMMAEVSFEKKKFYTINIKEQSPEEIASKFIELLSENNVRSGEALTHAQSIYKGKVKERAIKENLPKAWRKIISETDELLIDLLAETTESICGFKPDNETVKRFLKDYAPSSITDIPPIKKEPRPVRAEDISSEPSYIIGYRKQLKNPDNLISKILHYIEEKKVVGLNELKRVCVRQFGCKTETSGSIGASMCVLKADRYIEIDGSGDSKRVIFLKQYEGRR